MSDKTKSEKSGLWPFSRKSGESAGDSRGAAEDGGEVHEPGDLIDGRYVVEKAIPGGMGTVYIARDPRENIRFAIKQPNAKVLGNASFRTRVEKEADAWTRLGMHPHIAYCYFVRQINGVPYIFVEYAEGGTLRQWIMDKRAADFKTGLNLAVMVCHGMEFAHRKAMIHRDIKPENILMSEAGKPKICDFGLVGVAATEIGKDQGSQSRRGKTQYGAHMGTPPYMSPEQWTDPRKKSQEAPEGVFRDSDVFSFGVCLWEMFVGRRPYESTRPDDTKRSPDPAGLRPGMKKILRDVLLKSVTLEREKRIPDFRNLREHLNRAYKESFGGDAPAMALHLVDTAADELNNQGYSYFELGKTDAARKHFEKALAADPTNPHAVYNLALMRYNGGEIDDLAALAMLKDAERNPKNRGVIEELTARFLFQIGAPNQAKKVLRNLSGRFDELFRNETLSMSGAARELGGHELAVSSASVTPDGRLAVTGSRDGTLGFFQVATGERLGNWMAHEGGTLAAAISANGRMALTGGADRALRLWELSSGRLLAEIKGHDGPVLSVAISADGRHAISGGNDNTVRLWDLASKKEWKKFIDHTLRVSQVVMTPDGYYALSISHDNTMFFWGLGSGKRLAELKGAGGGHILTAAMTDDGKNALTGDNHGNLTLWDLASKKPVKTVSAHDGPVAAVALARGGRCSVSVGKDGRVRFLDLEREHFLRTLALPAGTINQVSLSTDGATGLLAGPGNRATVLEIQWTPTYNAPLSLSRLRRYEFKILEQSIHERQLDQARMLYDRGHAKLAHDLLMSAWKMNNFKEDPAFDELYRKLIPKSRFEKLATCHNARALKGHRDRVKAVRVFGPGQWAVTASYDKTLKRWDLVTGKCENTFRGHTDGVSALALSPDGRTLLSGGLDRKIRVWQSQTGQTLTSFETGRLPVTAIAFTNNGKHFLYGNEKFVTLAEIKTGKTVQTLNGEQVGRIAMASSGRFAIWPGMNYTAEYWDISALERKTVLTGHRSRILGLAITREGRFGITADADGLMQYWHLPTGRVLNAFTGHSGPVNEVVMSYCGCFAISAGEDKTLRLWDLIKGEEAGRIPGHVAELQAADLSEDGRFLVSCAADGSIMAFQCVWNLAFPAAKGRTDAFARY